MIALLAIPLIILALLYDRTWRKRNPKTAPPTEAAREEQP